MTKQNAIAISRQIEREGEMDCPDMAQNAPFVTFLLDCKFYLLSIRG